VVCEVRIVLTLNARLTPVVTAWHYDKAVSAPRLITAYPTPKMWNRCQQSVRSQP
jgi:hypothetical protein